ncbi:MAG: large conductance mechanosensitive channel protein MscL [Clostridia bacterium]|nr:large conductance mechanosensitive channel protein MscL [Clostridia bacterium]
MKKFFEEFKKFALRGNVIDMAVGVIIGGAFTGVVNSVSNNFIKPLLSFVTTWGESWGVMADGETPWSLPLAGADFLTTVINFIITALVLFIIIRTINKLGTIGKKPEAPKAPTTKKCPYCLSEIPIGATKCAHCASELPKE